jgi:hypothetical protein
MDADFKFSKYVVVESLKVGERKTGREIHDHIRLELAFAGEHWPVEYIQCADASEFRHVLQKLYEDASRGDIPLIHVECHGHIQHGLQFADVGNLMPWEEFAELLQRVNVASGFNLLVCVAACFGAYFAGWISAVKAAPCRIVIAPDCETLPAELESGFCGFYTTLIRTRDVSPALRVLRAKKLQQGEWFASLAEWHFEQILLGYFRTYCTMEGLDARIAGITEEGRRCGRPWTSQFDLRRDLKRQHQEALDHYFEIFFATRTTPTSAIRFSGLKTELAAKVEALRATGKYLL